MAQCSNCVSNKRRSPSDLYAQHPSSKRAALELPSSSASSSGEQLLQNGYTIMPTKNLYDQFSDGALPNSLINNPFQEQNSGVDSLPIPAQPSQQPLYRTYSEPIPEAYQVVATAASPRPPAAGKFTSPPGLLKQESPGTKRFRRMKRRLREMSKWWDEVIKEDEEEEDAVVSENKDQCPPKDDCDCVASQGSESEEACHDDQEAVWVERKGEVLILHFQCPCSKGYQILLSQNSCYYKLSSF